MSPIILYHRHLSNLYMITFCKKTGINVSRYYQRVYGPAGQPRIVLSRYGVRVYVNFLTVGNSLLVRELQFLVYLCGGISNYLRAVVISPHTDIVYRG